ncbi:MAG: helix-turn-helix domain-containing protein [Dysgonamonadaceae bacterium]|jgi:hypothetical protein|nr:helix-turn-helix domain-containing protein [Dysgonamonadaceae bacterium]
MEVITIESQAFKDLTADINTIAKYVRSMQKEQEERNVTDQWVDSYEVCTFLKISAKTLQRLRQKKAISYSQIQGKNYYKISEISRLINAHVIRSNDEKLQALITNHHLYAEQRRAIKAD